MNLKLKTFSFALLASASAGMYAQSHNDNKTTNDTERTKKEERNVMLNAADANKPREIQIGLPSEDVTVYENGLPAVYSSSVHKLSAHWRSDASLKGTDLRLHLRVLSRRATLLMLYRHSASWVRRNLAASSTTKPIISACRTST